MKLSDLQNKDIVNMIDGKNIGNIIDVNIAENGTILSFIIEPSKGMFRMFNKNQITEIAWSSIKRIGEDVILINTKEN